MIYVFKTSVKTKKDSLRLKPLLNEALSIAKWNFDLEDCDKILRIDSPTCIIKAIVKLLNNNGFECEELKD
nr:hypothetical protein [Flavobacterium psychrotrophum]